MKPLVAGLRRSAVVVAWLAVTSQLPAITQDQGATIDSLVRLYEANTPSLTVVQFRANEMDLTKEHYRLARSDLRDGLLAGDA